MAETYDSLLLQLRAIVNRDPDTDTSFADALPGIFERAERRIARDLNLSDFTKTQTGTLVIGEEEVAEAIGRLDRACAALEASLKPLRGAAA